MNDMQFNRLVDSLYRVQSKKELGALLQALLTPKELAELPKRLAIFEQLKKNTPQHEIADKIGVGVATVTRGSLEIKRGHIQQTSWWRNLPQVRG